MICTVMYQENINFVLKNIYQQSTSNSHFLKIISIGLMSGIMSAKANSLCILVAMIPQAACSELLETGSDLAGNRADNTRLMREHLNHP